MENSMTILYRAFLLPLVVSSATLSMDKPTILNFARVGDVPGLSIAWKDKNVVCEYSALIANAIAKYEIPYDAVRELDFSKNNIKDFDALWLKKCTGLRRLVLSENPLTTLKNFEALPAGITLELRGVNIARIQDLRSFSSLKGARVIVSPDTPKFLELSRALGIGLHSPSFHQRWQDARLLAEGLAIQGLGTFAGWYLQSSIACSDTWLAPVTYTNMGTLGALVYFYIRNYRMAEASVTNELSVSISDL